jgi:dimethylaniline monooxygenase (N-oxide forming)
MTSIRRSKTGGHIVSYSPTSGGHAEEWQCDAVAICTGLHVVPNVAQVSGIESIPAVIHSSGFKERKQFGVDKDIMILGSGETGMDLAYLAITSPTKSVTLCHRDGFLCAPKVSVSHLSNTWADQIIHRGFQIP